MRASPLPSRLGGFRSIVAAIYFWLTALRLGLV